MSEYYCPGCLGRHEENDCPEIKRLREELENNKINLDMIPGLCCMCGNSATYDGIRHRVTCDDADCLHYYENKSFDHASVIKQWNQLPSIELELALSRAEKAESERDTLRRQLEVAIKAFQDVRNEIGVPNSEYPANLWNAWSIVGKILVILKNETLDAFGDQPTEEKNG